MKIWRRKPALGIGIGMGVVGAVALALRYGTGRWVRGPIPDAISPAIFSTRVARTEFGEMIYHVSGAGEPLVFLHGVFLGASSYEWSKVYPRFAASREVMVPDLIGFGESERPGIPMDAADYVEALAGFLREVSPDRKPAVVASGLTAGICLLLAARHPGLVSRLVLFLPTGLKDFGKWRAMGMLALSGIPGMSRFVYRSYLSRPPFIRRWLARIALADPASLTEEMVSIFATCAQQYGAEHAILGFLRGRLDFHIERRLPDVAVPVRILWPDRATGFPPGGGDAICRRIPGASLTPLPGCGILAALENPDLVADAVVRALQDDLPADI
ncbi:MAG: alpha/beta hydrolase [Verrucomicrobiae bacterium]